MAVTLNANSSTGFIATSDTSGVLQLQTGGTTAVTISAGQVATFAQAPVLPAASIPQAALAAGVAGTGPAFSAYQNSAQTLSAATNTKITFDTEEFDTNSNFASSRFTPTVAGYYQINSGVSFGPSAGQVSIYKNGSEYKRGTQYTASGVGFTVFSVVYFNGSSDYVEIYANSTTGGPTNAGLTVYTYFNGAMVRSA
jgi:hypothetical protein